ncbi:carbonic anhydrase 7 isoform X1 [Arapaima gigas]
MTGHHWGYGEEDGPSEWHKDYPIAEGNRQSPIDIVPTEAVYDASLSPITLVYDHCTSLSISNNGHSVVVDFDDEDSRTGGQEMLTAGLFILAVIQNGPLEVPYRLKQFHFHWGGKSSHGSEHTIGGKTFVSELHLVHWNAAKYKTFGEAAVAPDGLAVLGVFLEMGEEHRGLHKITDALYMVKFKGNSVNFKDFNPVCLLPSNLSYWTYPGSLTTPPLHESVTWIVLKEPITVSEKQMGKFRMLLFSGEEEEDRRHMVNNFRPPQPLKGRKVHASFQ